jgi:thioredoxin 1
MSEIGFRFVLTLGLIGVGYGLFRLVVRVMLARANKTRLGLDEIKPGIPAILYFTTPECMPCKTIQRPALAQLQQWLGSNLQIVEVNAIQRKDLADYWGALSVPTTFVIDSSGEPRQVNHGVTSAEKLLSQLEKIEGRSLLDQSVEIKQNLYIMDERN